MNSTVTKENAIKETPLLFKWIIIHLNSANTKKKNACKRWREIDLETKKLQQHWKHDGCLVCVRLFQTFSFCSVFAFVSYFFFPLCLRHSLYWFLHFLLSCSADFICRKNGAKSKSQFLLLPCFSSLFFVFSFLFFLFYCLPSWSHSNARMKKKLPLFSAFFLS